MRKCLLVCAIIGATLNVCCCIFVEDCDDICTDLLHDERPLALKFTDLAADSEKVSLIAEKINSAMVIADVIDRPDA